MEQILENLQKKNKRLISLSVPVHLWQRALDIPFHKQYTGKPYAYKSNPKQHLQVVVQDYIRVLMFFSFLFSLHYNSKKSSVLINVDTLTATTIKEKKFYEVTHLENLNFGDLQICTSL